MIEKRQTLQGYIIRILQHFATKTCILQRTCLDQNLVYNANGPFATDANKLKFTNDLYKKEGSINPVAQTI